MKGDVFVKSLKCGRAVLIGLLALCLCVPAIAAEAPGEDTEADVYATLFEVFEGVETVRFGKSTSM